LVQKFELQEAQACELSFHPEGYNFELAHFNQQGPIVSVHEVEPSFELTDLDPEFHHRSETRKERYKRIGAESDAKMTNHERIATSITLTLARMIKNLHLSSYSGEDSSTSCQNISESERDPSKSERDGADIWEAMTLGTKILYKVSRL
jgi:hypothetical protein